MPTSHLYILGGSVPWGFPYAPANGVGHLVGSIWNEVNGEDLQIWNEAGYGKSSSFVLQRSRSIVNTLNRTEPAAAFIYSGNNEFLHLTTTKAGYGPGLMQLDDYETIVDRHRSNLQQAVGLLHDAGVDVMVCTIPVNLADWPPTYTTIPEDQPDLTEQIEGALRASRRGEKGRAEKLGRYVLEVDPRSAEANFIVGRCLAQRGQLKPAREFLAAACENDGRPIRATDAINDNIRELPDLGVGIRLIDARAHFFERSVLGVPGSDLFWDDCHPKFSGHALIAGLLSDQLAEIRGIDTNDMSMSGGAILPPRLDAQTRAGVLGRVGMYCYKHASVWNRQIPLALAHSYLEHAAELAPDSTEIHVTRCILFAHLGQIDDARNAANIAHRTNPERATWLLFGPEAKVALGGHGIEDIALWAGWPQSD